MYVYVWMYFYLTIINLYTARVFPEFLSTEMDVGHQSFEVWFWTHSNSAQVTLLVGFKLLFVLIDIIYFS